MTKPVAIILPSLILDEETMTYYHRFINSLRTHTPHDIYHLYIIDNGSKVGAERMAGDADVYYRSESPLGYAKAVNLGIEMAIEEGYTQFVVANNDIELSEAWLTNLVDMYRETGGLLAPQDHPTETKVLYPDESWYSLWLIDKKTWLKVGRLDDELLNYRFHDQEYSIRLKKAGFFVGRTGLIHVKHGNSITYKKMGRNEDPAEREEMIRRHGHALFSDWIRAQGNAIH